VGNTWHHLKGSRIFLRRRLYAQGVRKTLNISYKKKFPPQVQRSEVVPLLLLQMISLSPVVIDTQTQTNPRLSYILCPAKTLCIVGCISETL
jgi:hypothetical protein